MREVVMQTAETASMKEDTDSLVKILNSTYVKEDLELVADNKIQLNTEERNQLLSLLEDLEELFDSTFVYLYTEPINLEINPGSKLFNSKYYPVSITNKKTSSKELK